LVTAAVAADPQFCGQAYSIVNGSGDQLFSSFTASRSAARKRSGVATRRSVAMMMMNA
jgi:hypothetical protein